MDELILFCDAFVFKIIAIVIYRGVIAGLRMSDSCFCLTMSGWVFAGKWWGILCFFLFVMRKRIGSGAVRWI